MRHTKRLWSGTNRRKEKRKAKREAETKKREALLEAKDESIRLRTEFERETKDRKALYELVDSIKAISILLWPFIPNTSEKIASQLGFEIKYSEIEKPLKVKSVKKGEILFRKI